MAGEVETLLSLLAHVGALGPFVVVFEDTHWAEARQIELLAEIAEASARLPMIVVLTSRVEGERLGDDWRARLTDAQVWKFDLGPLTAKETRALAASFDWNGQLGDYVARSGGHPLYLEQLLRHQVEGQKRDLPHSIRALVQARVDLLNPEERELARAAAVLGLSIDTADLRALMGGAVHPTDGLVRRQILRPTKEGFQFHHALIRDAIYDSILREERARLHRRAADHFAASDAVREARHLSAADDPRAGAAFVRAAEDALANFRPDEALALCEEGLLSCADKELRELHARSLLETGRPADAIAELENLLQSELPSVAKLQARIGLARAMRQNDRVAEALSILDCAERQAADDGTDALLSELHYLRGALLFPKGDVAGSAAAHTRALDLAKASGNAEREAFALSGLGDALYAEGKMQDAADVFERCLALAEANGFARVQAANLFMRGTVRIYLLDLPGARADTVRSIDIAKGTGHKRAEIVSRLTLGWIHLFQGEPDAAAREATRGLALADAIEAHRFKPFLRETLGAVAIIESRIAAAREIMELAWSEVEAANAKAFIGPWVLGTLARSLENSVARRNALKKGEALLRAGAVGHNHFQFRRQAIEIGIAEGDDALVGYHSGALTDFVGANPDPWSRLMLDRAAREVGERRDFAGLDDRLTAAGIRFS